MDDCPDNSTACLIGILVDLNRQVLSAINDQNNQFNWDPASFIVTLAIGVLAFIVACLTVFQGILAAGSGRVKAGRTAIGPWSKKSRSTFSWEELGVRTTAVTPVIQVSEYGLMAIPDKRGDEVDVTGLEEYGATWVNLLSLMGMSNVEWRNYKTVGTDYLPADIQGPPATVHVKSLITLAAMADDYCSINTTSNGRFLTMTGLFTSVSIREHPVLGTVAAFEMHSTPRTAKPFIFMQPSLAQEQERMRPFFAKEHMQPSLAQGHTPCGVDQMNIAFNIRSVYALGEGQLNAGSGKCQLANCSVEDAEADIPRIRANFLANSEILDFSLSPPSIFTALITGAVPSRPRLVPKATLNLKEAACRLVSGSLWETESTFPARFESLLQVFVGAKTVDESAIRPGRRWHVQWDGLMMRSFGYSWSPSSEKQRETVAMQDDIDWPSFEQSAFYERMDAQPSFLDRFKVGPPGFSCRRDAVTLKRFLECVIKDDTMELTGESKLKHIFTAVDIAAVQVGFQAEIVLLDRYLVRSNKEDVACALMVLLKHISSTGERPEVDVEEGHTVPERPYQRTEHEPSLSFALDHLNSASYAEAYGIKSLPEKYWTDITSGGKMQLSTWCSLDDASDESRVVETLTTPEATSADWAHLWYSRRETAEDRQRVGLLAELMRYRALLFIAVLDMCADSTILLDEHFDRAMVKMI